MVVFAEAIYKGGSYELVQNSQTGLWVAEIEALRRKLKTDERKSYYPIMLRVVDDAGNVSVKTTSDAEIGEDLRLIVREVDLFPDKFILANALGEELGVVDAEIDLDLGDTNDLEVITDSGSWLQSQVSYGCQLYVPGTEYGGLLEERTTSTKSNTVAWYGYTWRGLLSQKIIQPPTGQSHLVMSGDANSIIKSVVGSRYGALFVVDEVSSDITLSNYQFDRYCTLLSGIEKMLASKGARIKIYYQQGESLESGSVHLCAVPITDWSEYVECSQDGKLNFSTCDYRRGINHLICAGEGEGIDRAVIHLYVQQDGSVGDKQYYCGLDEREALYSYTSQEDVERLKEDGTKRLKELMNYKQMEATLDSIDVDIGDIVGGRDYMTGMEMLSPVIKKILIFKEGKVTINYEIKGDD